MSRDIFSQARAALAEDHVDVLHMIVPSQLSPNACFQGKPLLVYAIEASALLCIQHLFDECVDIEQCDSTGKSPLHVAVMLNKKQALVMLLNAGADPNSVDDDGWTPLHWAVHLHNKDFARILYGLDANPDFPDYEGTTPRMMAREHGDTSILELFAETPEPRPRRLPFCGLISSLCFPL